MAESNGPASLDAITDCEEDDGVQNCDHEPRLEFDDSELEQNKPEGNCHIDPVCETSVLLPLMIATIVLIPHKTNDTFLLAISVIIED